MSTRYKTDIFHNFYECPCGHKWDDHWSSACDDKCPACGKEIMPCDSEIEPYVIELPFYGIRIELNQVDPENNTRFIGGSITSNLLKENIFLNFPETYLPVVIEILESSILKCACTSDLIGVEIGTPTFEKGIKMYVDEVIRILRDIEYKKEN